MRTWATNSSIYGGICVGANVSLPQALWGPWMRAGHIIMPSPWQPCYATIRFPLQSRRYLTGTHCMQSYAHFTAADLGLYLESVPFAPGLPENRSLAANDYLRNQLSVLGNRLTRKSSTGNSAKASAQQRSAVTFTHTHTHTHTHSSARINRCHKRVCSPADTCTTKLDLRVVRL